MKFGKKFGQKFMSNIWNNIKRDEERIKEYYVRYYKVERETMDWFSANWFNHYFLFLEEIPDLSEEFHRKYYSFYELTLHWGFVFFYQTNLSEQFYDDFFGNMVRLEDKLSVIIRNNRVSSKWIEKNLYRIPPEVWNKVYE
jgi:hypothetical protein